jgi:hypothetical protein
VRERDSNCTLLGSVLLKVSRAWKEKGKKGKESSVCLAHNS